MPSQTTLKPKSQRDISRPQATPTRCGTPARSTLRLAELVERHTSADLRFAEAALRVVADDRAERRRDRLPELKLSDRLLDCLKGIQPRIAMLAVLAWDDGDWPPSGSVTGAVDELQDRMTHRHLSMRLRHASSGLGRAIASQGVPRC